MSLPEGFDRDNNKMYEEVNLPPSTDAPANVGEHLISISDLDEVGIYTIIYLKSVVVRKLHVAILARSPREMSQTDRIV